MSAAEADPSERTGQSSFCRVCLFECDDSETAPSSFDQKLRNVFDRLNGFRDMVHCASCSDPFHQVCFDMQLKTGNGDNRRHPECFSCRNPSQTARTCLICHSQRGQVLTYTHHGKPFHGHFLCLYFSPRFLFLNSGFVPIQSSVRLSGSLAGHNSSDPTCTKCNKPVDINDSTFKCACGHYAHVFCCLYERMSAMSQEKYTDSAEGGYPVLRLDKGVRKTSHVQLELSLLDALVDALEPTLRSLGHSQQSFLYYFHKNQSGLKLEITGFEFLMTCESCYDYNSHSLFCCNRPTDAELTDFIQCSLCSLWVHQNNPACAQPRQDDDQLLSQHLGIKLNLRNRKKGLKLASRLSKAGSTSSDSFFSCPDCFGLAASLVGCDDPNAKVHLMGHQHPLSHLLVRQVTFQQNKSDHKIFELFRETFGSVFHLKTEHFAVLNRFLQANKSHESSESAFGGLQEQLLNLLRKQSVGLEDITGAEGLVDSLRSAIEDIRGGFPNQAITLEQLDLLKRLFSKLCKIAENEKGSVTDQLNFLSILFQKTTSPSNPLYSLVFEFVYRNVIEPVNSVSDEFDALLREALDRNQEVFNTARNGQVSASKDIMEYLQSLPTVHEVDRLIARHSHSVFAVRHITHILQSENFRQGWDADLGILSSYSDYQTSLKKLLRVRLYDETKEAALEDFFRRFEAAKAVNKRLDEAKKKLRYLRKLETTRTFLKRFDANLSHVLSLETLESLHRDCEAIGLRAKTVSDTLVASQAINSQLCALASKWQLCQSDMNPKQEIKGILRQVIGGPCAVSAPVMEFLKLYRHRQVSHMLENPHNPLTLAEYVQHLNGINEACVRSTFVSNRLTQIRTARENLAEQVRKAFETKATVANFPRFAEEVNRLTMAAEKMRQRHPELETWSLNMEFWQTLEGVFVDDVDENLEVTPENLEFFTRSLETCSLAQAERLHQLVVPRFVVVELERLYAKALKRYWDLKVTAVLDSNARIDMSLIQAVHSTRRTDPELMGTVLQKVSPQKANFLVSRVGEATRAEEQVLIVCARIVSERDLFGNMSEIAEQIENVFGMLAGCRVDTSPLDKNLYALYFFAVVLKLLHEAQYFVKLTRSHTPVDNQAEAQTHVNRRNRTPRSESKGNFSEESQQHAITGRAVGHRYPSPKVVLPDSQMELELISESSFYKRLETIAKFFRKVELRFADPFGHFRDLIDSFNSFFKTLKECKAEVDFLIIVAKSARSLSSGERAPSPSFQHEEFVRRIAKTTPFAWFFSRRLGEIAEFDRQFQGTLKRLLDIIAEVADQKISVVSRSRLSSLDLWARNLEAYPLESPFKTRLLECVRAIQVVFSTYEKSSKIIRTAIEDCCDRLVGLDPGHTERTLVRDLEFHKAWLDQVDSAVLSLKTKVEMESDFRRSIESIQGYLRDSPLKSSFSFLTYSEFRAELDAVSAFANGNPNAYIAHLSRAKAEFQLTEAMQAQLEHLRRCATKYNSYAERNLSTLVHSEKYKLYRVLKHRDTQLSGFHAALLHEFYEGIAAKRAPFEMASNMIDGLYDNGQPVKDLSVLYFPDVINNDFLEKPKKQLFISALEVTMFLLKRAFVLVDNWHPNAPNSPQLVALVHELRLEVVSHKLEQKDDKGGRRIFQICLELSQAFMHCLIRRLQRKCEAHGGIWPINLLHPFAAKVERVFEAKKVQLTREFRAQAHQMVQIRHEEVPSQFREDFAPDSVDMTHFILRETVENMEEWNRRAVEEFQRKITDSAQEPTSSNNLVSSFVREFEKATLIEKNPMVRQKIYSLCQKLAAWVEEGEREDRLGMDRGNRRETGSSGTGLLRKRVEPSQVASGVMRSLGCTSDQIESVTSFKSRSTGNRRKDDAKKQLMKLGQKPDLCKEIVRSDFSFDHLLSLIAPKEDKSLQEVSRSLPWEADGSRSGRGAIPNVPDSAHSFIPFESSLRADNEFSNQPPEQETLSECSRTLKRTKVSDSPPFFPSQQAALYTYVWELSIFTLRFQQVSVDLTLETSLDPNLFPALFKSQVFVNAKAVDLFQKQQREIQNLMNAHGSNGVIGSAFLQTQLEETLRRIASGGLSPTSMFGGWFRWTEDEVKHPKGYCNLEELFEFARRTNCFLEEVFSMNGVATKAFIGCATLLTPQVARWLNIQQSKNDQPVSLERIQVFIIHKRQEEPVVATNTDIQSYVKLRIVAAGKDMNQTLQAVNGIRNCEYLWREQKEAIRMECETAENSKHK